MIKSYDLLKPLKKITFLLGIIIFIIPYGRYLLQKYYFFGPTISFFFYGSGIILICDYITSKIGKFSLLFTIIKKRNILKYVLVGFSGGLLLEGLAQWIFKLWFYPFWTNYFYFFVFAFGFSFYFLMITESYLVIKVLIDKKTKGTKRITKPFKNENIVYKFLFVLGIIFFIFGIGSLMSNYESLDLEFNINIIKQYKMPFYDIIMIFFGVWFILEFVEFKLHRTSLIKDMTHKYYNPFLSILISSFLLATIIETQNLGVGLWEYFNWPYPEIKFLGIPLFVYLIWPLHYIGFLSLFRVMDIKLSLSIWKGDEIK